MLGATTRGKSLLSQISPKVKVITSLKKFESTNKNLGKIARLLEIDKMATDIYTIGYRNNSEANLDYTKNIILQ